uniref:uncharacterized protein LOC117611402 n=1 Tax=Osmia lignaria TaxID=473952 RepID=UPI001478FF20|nr:uncharacterized protein LOC117611402 [Osmia lignaria]
MWKRKLQANRTWKTLLPSTCGLRASSNSGSFLRSIRGGPECKTSYRCSWFPVAPPTKVEGTTDQDAGSRPIKKRTAGGETTWLSPRQSVVSAVSKLGRPFPRKRKDTGSSVY